jgi:predicted Zn-dependent protease
VICIIQCNLWLDLMIPRLQRGVRMSKKSIINGYVAGLLFFIFLFVACQTVPLTGRKRLILVPESTEFELGATTYDDILKKSKLSSDAQTVNRVKIIGQRIAQVTERADYAWEFNLIDDDKIVNAFCLPGGKVAVYTGIMKLASTDDELATVMGHEIAHAIARHGSERMTQLLLVELGGMALEEALKKETQKTIDLAKVAYGAGTALLFVLPYSRTHENEADHMGLIFMAKADYDPHAAVDFWKKMQEQFAGQEPPEFLSTHPSSQHRVSTLEKWLPEALEYYHK